MIVDGDLAAAHSLSDTLQKAGHSVVVVDSARAGRLLARRLQPDIAFVDLKVSDGDGATLLRSLRQCSPHTYVAITTNFGSLRSAVEVMRLGAADYLEKPVDVEAVSLAIARTTKVPKRSAALRFS